jgi:PhnB protein
MHIALSVGQDMLMATDALESMGFKLTQGNRSYIMIQVESKAEADRIFNALSAGGRLEIAMTDQPWGECYGSFRDKFGTGWMVDSTYPKK